MVVSDFMRTNTIGTHLDFLISLVMSGGVEISGGHVFSHSLGKNWPSLG